MEATDLLLLALVTTVVAYQDQGRPLEELELEIKFHAQCQCCVDMKLELAREIWEGVSA